MNTTSPVGPAPETLPPAIPAPWLGLPLSRGWRDDTLRTATRLQRVHGDVVRGRILFRDFVWLFDPGLARQVLLDKEDDYFKDPRQLSVFQDIQGRNVLTVDGPDWARQRRILTPAFSARRMAGYLPLMEAAARTVFRDVLPERAGTGVEVDAEAFCSRLTMDVITRALFSEAIAPDASAQVSQALTVVSRQGQRELFWPWTPPDWLPYPGRGSKLAAARFLNDWVARQIDARQAIRPNGGEDGDILDAMLAAREDGAAPGQAGLSRREVHDNCMAIFLAGHETSAKALAWWMGLMARHPAVVEAVRHELDALPAEVFADGVMLERALSEAPWLVASVKEAMRLYPPIIATFLRRARRDLKLGDYHIRRGTSLSVMIVTLQRDARWFPEPEAFLPERFLPGAAEVPRGAYMPFGAGGHVCIGQHFATVELALMAALLLRCFDLTPLPGDPLPEPRVDIVLRPERPLRVRVTART